MHRLRERLNELLRRHVREEDETLSDQDFVIAVFARFEADRILALIDPAE